VRRTLRRLTASRPARREYYEIESATWIPVETLFLPTQRPGTKTGIRNTTLETGDIAQYRALVVFAKDEGSRKRCQIPSSPPHEHGSLMTR
jgi:hypothetical protein